jgi:putative hydrolase of the HAD superfamily
MEPKNFEAIIFDFGGVLIDLDIEKTYEELSRLVGFDPFDTEVLVNKLYESFEEFEVGSISSETFIWRIQNLTDKNIDPIKILQGWNAMLLGWNPAKLDFLRRIKEKYPIYLLSNTNEIHLNWVYKNLEEQHGIKDFDTRFFIKTYYSHKIGYRKPDEAAFLYVINDAGLDPSKTLFVDDNFTNILGGSQAGLQVIHHPINDSLEYLFDYSSR